VDIASETSHVRKVPEPDIRLAQVVRLFD
jgi:hypothetical protein